VIGEFLAQRKFVSAGCHAHSNAHNVAPTVFILVTKFKLKCIVIINTYRLTKKKNLRHPQTDHNLKKIVNMNVDTSETIKDRELGFPYLDSVALYAAQVCYANMPRPLLRPQTPKLVAPKILTGWY